jgi:two-component sensor histidine kinase
MQVEGRVESAAEGAPRRAIGAVVDITGRKRVEEALKASLQENRDLLHELEHRVKNSLQMISSMIYFSSRASGPEMKAVYDELMSRVNSLSELYYMLASSDSFSSVRLDLVLDLGARQAER